MALAYPIAAIGDIHGEYDMLLSLIDEVTAQYPQAHLVFLGDYVDRGPKSRQVVELVRTLVNKGLASAIKGNHEDIWYYAKNMWIANGGPATIMSYRRLDGSMIDDRPDAEWAFKLPTKLETEHHIFVHAGVDPDRPMDEQSNEFMTWARPEDWVKDYKGPKFVVYGHTPRPGFQPLRHEHSIGIDTGGCFKGGALTAAILTGPGAPTQIIRQERGD